MAVCSKLVREVELVGEGQQRSFWRFPGRQAPAGWCGEF